MPVELFIARRYLRAKRKQAVISVITAISTIGVAAGVMALIVALAINNGFRLQLQSHLLGATSHVNLLEVERGRGIEDWRAFADQAPDLGHQHEFVARLVAQHSAEASLGQPAAVQRRRVEEADARIPRGRDQAMAIFVRDGFVEPAQRGLAQAELGDLESRTAEGDAFQRSKIFDMRSLLSPLKSWVTAIIVAISASQRMLVGSCVSSAIARS